MSLLENKKQQHLQQFLVSRIQIFAVTDVRVSGIKTANK